MQIVSDSLHSAFPDKPFGLTIGTFDGVHLGHIFLLNHLRSLLPQDALLAVYTFTNHPTQVVSNRAAPIPLIYTLEHKCKLLAENNVDFTLLRPFTKKFAQTPFDLFLKNLLAKLPFSYLVLGEDARFGKAKEGTRENVEQLAHMLRFKVEYLPRLYKKGIVVSASHIRTLIQQGNFSEAKVFLGRPYSIYAPIHFHQGHHHMRLEQLCLPPTGTYRVHTTIAGKKCPGHVHIDQIQKQIHLDFTKDIILPNPIEIEFEIAE